MPDVLAWIRSGSSPHTRGTRTWTWPKTGASRDHPRIRGEHLNAGCVSLDSLGIIPAYAGNTYVDVAENGRFAGSSPHTRGTPRQQQAELAALGIIPAYAGNTDHPYGHQGSSWDHPRIRGEHEFRDVGCGHAAGIIPAYAGNTAPPSRRRGRRRGSSPHTRGTPHCACRSNSGARDHPRIRGEHFLVGDDSGLQKGIIPAYAGNTGCELVSVGHGWGSSPHTRGTLL